MKLPPVPCRKSAKAEKVKTDFPDFLNQQAWPSTLAGLINREKRKNGGAGGRFLKVILGDFRPTSIPRLTVGWPPFKNGGKRESSAAFQTWKNVETGPRSERRETPVRCR